MSGTLALASAIAVMDRPTLTALVQLRRPQAAANVTDPIGLASELLRSESITRTLAPLDRTHLAALLGLDEAGNPAHIDAEVLDTLSRIGLIGIDGDTPVALPEVTSALRQGLTAAGVTPDSLRTQLQDPLPREHDADTSTWFASAVTAVSQSAEILRVLRERPGRLNRNGAIAVAAVRILSEVTSVEPAQVSRALGALEQARLIWSARSSQLLRCTEKAPEWLASNYGERWLFLARATLDAMPSPLRSVLPASRADVSVAIEHLPRVYPLLPASDIAAAVDFAQTAEYLGLTVTGVLSPQASALLAQDNSVSSEQIIADLPGVAPGIYVQPDLSVVIPGPLDPQDEAEIASLSRPEHIGVATTRRVTEASLADAIEHGGSEKGGVTAESARATFERLSLTGIPQPLDYLLTAFAGRVGSVVVSEHLGDEGRTRVTVSRPEMRQTILVDRSLQHAQFTPSPTEPGVLYSRLRREHVVAALSDARYPAMAETARTPTFSTAAQRAGEAAEETPAPPNADLSPELTAAIERVYLAARSEPGRATSRGFWNSRFGIGPRCESLPRPEGKLTLSRSSRFLSATGDSGRRIRLPAWNARSP
ncbi:hypothetical protein G7067_00480 [Leucobacter insecticola]|uniref:Helicase XPB/Ssl2 N-terminal domain-containing protein n=1 Tax=Leucobacter insecticola TaxID=2714934 RepID=A0A6G8FGS7_9MICO|nr:helicase-associated domain-containing protein [Leucobacter insecticola]QIM15232.1 hypothetical protein G7067_00480 [Leucobacter insecticola]